MNPGMPGGGMPPPPPMGGPMGGSASPSQGGSGDDPHDKIIDALKRIEEKLAQIAAKVGA